MGNGTAVMVRGDAVSTAATVVEAPRVTRLLVPIADAADVVAAQNAARQLVHGALKEGRDYGKIPGTAKPTMLKPGAERVALGFGCYYGLPEIIEQEIDHDREVKHAKGTSFGLYRYVVRLPVIERATGEVVGSGIGSCSSMESKYISRPRDVENTIIKMAVKRAMVAACLSTFGLSDEFTQDADDLTPESAAPVLASDDIKLQIRKLLATADLADEKKHGTLALLDKPLSLAKAQAMLAKLEQLQNPPTSSPDSAPPTSETTPSGASATAGKKGKAPTINALVAEITTELNNAGDHGLLSAAECAAFVAEAADAKTAGDLQVLLGEIRAQIGEDET